MLVTLGTLRPSVSRPESASPASGLLQRADGSRGLVLYSVLILPVTVPAALPVPLPREGRKALSTGWSGFPSRGPALLVLQTSTS